MTSLSINKYLSSTTTFDDNDYLLVLVMPEGVVRKISKAAFITALGVIGGGGSGDVTREEFDALQVMVQEIAGDVADKEDRISRGTASNFINGSLNLGTIADNLSTDEATSVLSAKQGRALKLLYDALAVAVDGKATTGYVDTAVGGKADASALAGKADIAGEAYTGTHDFSGGTVEISDAVANDQPMSLGQGTALVAGVNRRPGVRVVATGNVDISTALEVGDVVNGYTLTLGDWVLLPLQTDQTQNGIYAAPASGAASRVAPFDTFDEHVGAIVTVALGSTLAGSQWQCTALAGGTLGVDPITFIQTNNGAGALIAANNGSDIPDKPLFRATIGLGSAATKNEADLARSTASIAADNALQAAIDALAGGSAAGSPSIDVVLANGSFQYLDVTQFTFPILVISEGGAASTVALATTTDPLTTAAASATYTPVTAPGNTGGSYAGVAMHVITTGAGGVAPTRLRVQRDTGVATNSNVRVRSISGSVRPVASGIVGAASVATPVKINPAAYGLGVRFSVHFNPGAGCRLLVAESFTGENGTFINEIPLMGAGGPNDGSTLDFFRVGGAVPVVRARLDPAYAQNETTTWEAFS